MQYFAIVRIVLFEEFFIGALEVWIKTWNEIFDFVAPFGLIGSQYIRVRLVQTKWALQKTSKSNLKAQQLLSRQSIDLFSKLQKHLTKLILAEFEVPLYDPWNFIVGNTLEGSS